MTSLELLERSFIDPLTGAAATRGFEQRCLEELDRTLRLRLRLTVLAVHADAPNRAGVAGVTAPDPLVRALGVFLLASIRGTDILGRRPGGGFAIVLAETGMSGAITLAERLHKAVGRIVTRQGDKTVPLTVTIGAAALAEDAGEPENLEPLIRRAEMLVSEARRVGGNRIVIEK